jgi:hypothetical protein
MLPEKYNELLEKSVQMEYKKASPQVAKEIEESHKTIVKSLDLQTRVYETTKREPFTTVKDHKANFQNNTKCRLINPSKPDIGKISKQMLEKVNPTIRQKTGLKQWKNTDSVIDWFKKIQNKRNKNLRELSQSQERFALN